MKRPLFVAGACLSFALAACRTRSAAVASPPAPAAGAARVAGPSETEEARGLCLAEPAGMGAVDAQLRVAQDQVRALPLNSGTWVAAGRQWVRKARLGSDGGFYLNVEGCAAAALGVEVDSAAALELRSLALMNDHKFEEARRVAETILAREPENLVALGTLSDAHLELGHYDEAARAAQGQMDVRPGMASYARGSYLRWLKGDDRKAVLLIRDALRGRDARDPEPAAWTFVEAATLFWHRADYDGADAVYAEALKWVPDYPSALLGRARVALAREQPAQAVAYLEKADRIRPLPESAWLLGDAREMLGDLPGSRADYARVVERGRRGDALTLALFYATKGRDVPEALRLVEQERSSRGGIHVDDVYAWALFRAGRLAEARKASDRALRLGTKEARLLYHAGAIRSAQGDANGGRTLVVQALGQNPHFDRTGAAEARALLERTRERRTASQ